MYASVQTRLDNLRTQALSHQYTKYALERIDAYKQRVQQLREETAADLAARRETLVQTLQGQRDSAVSELRQRRDRVAETVKEKQQRAHDAVTTQRKRAVELVQKKRDSAEEAVVVRKQRVIATTKHGVETVLSVIVLVIANVVSVAIKIFTVLRNAAPSKLVSSVETAIATVKPHAECALGTAQQLDEQYLRGTATAVTRTMTERVTDRLQLLEQQQAETPTPRSTPREERGEPSYPSPSESLN